MGRRRFLNWLSNAIAMTLLVGFVTCAPVNVVAKPIVLWTNHRLEDEPGFEEIIRRFESQNPGISIEWHNQVDGQVNYYDLLTVAILGGVVPDVFYVRPGTDFQFAVNEWTYRLDSLIQRDALELQIADFIPAQIEELMHDGEWWALPYDFSAIGLYYNEELFDAAGVPYPQPGSTWDDIANMARRLTRVDGELTTQWGLTGLNWFFSQWAEGFIKSFGGSLFNESVTAPDVVNPGTVAAFEAVRRLTYELEAAAPVTTPNHGTLFAAGNAAMTLDGSWATTTHRIRNDFRFDVSALPHGSAGLTVSATGGGWAMAANTENPEAAWLLMKTLIEPETMRMLVVEPVRSLPPRIPLMAEWSQQVAHAGAPGSARHLAEQILAYGRAIPKAGFSFSGILGSYRDQILSNQISPREAAERIEHDFAVEFDRLSRE